MLTNVHNYILREVLREKKQNIDEISAYLYNIAPDALPLHKNISANITHKTEIPLFLLEKYSQLVYIKYHLLVDNLGHYNDIVITNNTRDNFGKKGYAYLKGREVLPYLRQSSLTTNTEITDNDMMYLSHIIIEIALDYKVYKYDNSIARFFFEATTAQDERILKEYYQALSELYKVDMGIIKQSREEPAKFYQGTTTTDDFFLNRRSYLLLRKLKKDFTEDNIKYAVELVKIADSYLNDYQDFLTFCVNKILSIEDIAQLKIVADE